MFIPKGFAHGYLSLADETIVHYKVDEFYNATFEEGINFRDPKFNIDWEISFDSLIISEKDKNLWQAINKGIKASKGEVICILNSDDIFFKNAL